MCRFNFLGNNDMSFMDSLVSAATGALGQSSSGVMGVVQQLLQETGGISGLVQKFQANGLGDVVQSWVGTGANASVSAQQIVQVLGQPLLTQLAGKLGSSGGDVAQLVAQHLPTLVNHLTPDGQVPAGNGLDGLGALGALAGQLFGKS
jgi:uncharacterized protein YidB (DUF937 family)